MFRVGWMIVHSYQELTTNSFLFHSASYPFFGFRTSVPLRGIPLRFLLPFPVFCLLSPVSIPLPSALLCLQPEPFMSYSSLTFHV